jgi:hypothetical protein
MEIVNRDTTPCRDESNEPGSRAIVPPTWAPLSRIAVDSKSQIAKPQAKGLLWNNKSPFGANAGRADARHRNAGDAAVRRRGAETPQEPGPPSGPSRLYLAIRHRGRKIRARNTQLQMPTSIGSRVHLEYRLTTLTQCRIV